MTDTIDRSDTAGDDRVLDHLVVRFAGDSGDGMQLTGDRFTSVSASFGNDLSTLPDFPAEIRAPAGTVNGVSAFQVNIADHEITTPGDEPNVLVAMNAAALKADLHRLQSGGTLIVNEDSFGERDLEKAGYVTDDGPNSETINPLEDDSLNGYRVLRVPMTSLTKQVCEPLGVKPRDAERSKNFFALGLVSWMYTRPVGPTEEWIDEKFAKSEQVAAANKAAFRAGFNFGETTEAVGHRYEVRPATLPPGTYTSITGNTALSWGLVAAGQLAKLPITLGSYPITPASDILHELSKHKHFGIRTVQAEDEIAAVGVALGASFAGHLGITTTSGPGLALKSETVSLAVAIELPMLIIDIQRGGPSTGLPTKTEASDLNLALYGRHGESPLPVVASYSPAHCFHAAIEAVRIALKYRTPVILLSDGYLANGSEPWKLPDVDIAARHLGAVHDRTESRRRRRQRRVLAVPSRSRDVGPAVGDPGDPRSDASGRRTREAGRHRQHRLHTREPREDDRAAGSEGRGRRDRHPTDRGRRRRRRRCPRTRMGLHVGGDRRCGPAATAGRREGGQGPHHPSQPASFRPRRSAAALQAGHPARTQPGPTRPPPPRHLPDRHHVGLEDSRSPVQVAARSKTPSTPP